MLWKFLKNEMSKHLNKTLSDSKTSLTYDKLIKESEKIAEDIAYTNKWGIFCQSELNTAIAILACFAAGVTAVPLSKKYGSKHCKDIVNTIGITQLIVDEDNLLDFFDNNIQSIYRMGFGFLRKKLKGIEEELVNVSLIMCTSGTTGNPKGAMISKTNIYHNLIDIKDYFKINENQKILICRPLYHCAVLTGEFLISLIKGLDICFYDEEFNPIRIIEKIRLECISVMGGTPTLFYHICRIARRVQKPLRLEIIAISGECMTQSFVEIINETMSDTKIYNVYGLTEASPRTTYLSPELFKDNPFSVGRPLSSIKCKIVDSTGGKVICGEVGQLLISGPNIMKGYYRNKIATNNVFENGWLKTGDMAYADKNGLIYIKGRIDNMIIRAGMNIYPQEIENKLKGNNNIIDVMVYGFDNQSISQKIGMKVVSNLDKEQIFSICKKKLSKYQLPDVLEIVGEVDRNASGKVIRKNERI